MGDDRVSDELDIESFGLVAKAVERASGIEFADDARSTAGRRIAQRVSAAGFTKASDYASFLAGLPASHGEVQALVELVATQLGHAAQVDDQRGAGLVARPADRP